MRSCKYPCRLVCVLLTAALLSGVGCTPAEPDAQSQCGDGITEGSEQCDNGWDRNSDTIPNSCRTTCVWYFCGDGVTDVDEECDDGNNVSNDGCSDVCVHQIMCGDGLVEGNEQCDDGNTIPGDGCSGGCVLEWVCGDGVCETERQENCPACPEDCCPCGDGTCDQSMGETCSICQDDCCPDCGDGALDPSEQCDDGNNTDNDGCSAGCLDEDGTPTCGNGIWEAGEGCEDGNTTPGDGCSDVCQVEYVCGDGLCEDTFGETCQICPADCCPSCGNGTLEPAEGEECDGASFGGVTCENSCYTGGTPTCTNYCALDMTSCVGTLPVCGNATAECGEDCDGADLGGVDCYTFGLDGGTLVCDGSCGYDTTGCGPLMWYFAEDFEDPTTHATWSFGTGEWEIGTIGAADNPPAAHGGTYAMATNLGGAYANNDRYEVDRAVTPPINLTVATAPALRFWMWVDSEGCCDGFAMFIITTNGGAAWTHLTGPTPAYNATQGSYQCFQENSSTLPAAWTQVDFDLTAYAGQTIQLGFSFYSDGSVTYTGPHVDDILVAEPGAMP